MNLFIALDFTVALLFRALVAQPFTIPPSSMAPTIELGDYVVASKFSYGYSNFSLPSGELLPGFSFRRTLAKRGDVVIFRLPSAPSVDYVKRVIGLPGDKVQVTDGITYVNGEPFKLVAAGYYTSGGSASGLDTYKDIPMLKETLPDGRAYFVLDLGPLDGDNTPVFNVPDGHYFVMGDNRDNSSDSRFSVGYVPVANVYAKVLVAITWPGGKFAMRDIK